MRLTKTISIAALSTLALAGPAMADRRTGMGGNILIEDRDDMFVFPQLVLKYKNLVGMDYNGSQGSGNGVLTFGKGKTAFGIIVNRADASAPIGAGMYTLDYELGQNGGMAQPLLGANGSYTAPSTIVDFLFGTKMGNKNLGFRVALGHGGTNNSPDGGDPSSDGTTVIRAGGGLTLPGISMRGDIGFDLGLAFGGDTDNGDANGSDLTFGLGFNSRFYKKMTDNMDLGILASLGFSMAQSTNTSDGADNDTASLINFNLLGGFGPVYKAGNSTVAGYGIAGFRLQSGDPSSEGENDAFSNFELWLPGFRIAFEHELFEWLYFRSGMEYTWRLVSSSQEVGNASSSAGKGSQPAFDNGYGSGDSTFGWNAGLGIKLGNFRFDGALSHSYLTAGPDMLGGDGNMFVQSSATYTW